MLGENTHSSLPQTPEHNFIQQQQQACRAHSLLKDERERARAHS